MDAMIFVNYLQHSNPDHDLERLLRDCLLVSTGFILSLQRNLCGIRHAGTVHDQFQVGILQVVTTPGMICSAKWQFTLVEVNA